MKFLLVLLVSLWMVQCLAQPVNYGLVRKNFYSTTFDPLLQQNIETFDSATVRMAKIDPTTGFVENIGTYYMNDGINLTGAALNPYDSTYIFIGFTDIKALNVNTGELVSSAPLTNPIAPSYFDNFRFNNSDSTMYGLARRNQTNPTTGTITGSMYLASVNPSTGIITQISPNSIGQGFAYAGSAIDPYEMVYYYSNGSQLVGLDLYSGLIYSSPTIVFPNGETGFTNFVFSCADSSLYGLASKLYYSYVYDASINQTVQVLDSATARLAKINPQTGLVTIISPTSLSSSSYSLNGGAAIDPVSMTYYYNTGGNFVGVSLITGLETSNPGFTFEEGTYFDMVRNVQNCQEVSPTRLNSSASTNGLEEEELVVFPNPFLENVTIQCPSGIKSIQLLSMDGRVVYHKQISSQETCTLDLSFLNIGMYTLLINDSICRKIHRQE